MDMNKYCRHCGAIVETNYELNKYTCPTCKKDYEHKDIIAGWTRESRINQLKAMHELMTEANDEMIYMSWIYLMPDCPSEEDIIDIAMDDEQYNECFDLFVKLIKKEGNRW